MKRRKLERERRSWPRLPLAIPVFVRSRDENGRDFLEFATTLNVSAGGALVAVRRSLRLSSLVSLEIPIAPIPNGNVPPVSRILRARALRVTHAEGYHLVGLKFSTPMSSHAPTRPSRRRKLASPM